MTKLSFRRNALCYEKQNAFLEIGFKGMRAEKEVWNGVYLKTKHNYF